jgi:L-alanine-DL-glutamate epimerase-like enolase superfamily enzyme
VRATAPIDHVSAAAYTIPTDAPESDGTLEWDSTTLVVAWVAACGVRGVGYTYADTATACLIRDKLGPSLLGQDALAVPACWTSLVRATRNLGRAGIAAMAISALDVALWDLKAKLLGCALGTLLGKARDAIAAYGSGGFTSYSATQLQRQLAGWAREGLPAVKMKVGRDAAADSQRVAVARRAIGADVALFVDANGAYSQELAQRQANAFAQQDVRWFEEPVSSDDLEGLALLRRRRPAGMAIAAGEYGYDSYYFLRMLRAGAVDTLQADATRCGGVTGFLDAAALADAFGVPLSSHCAPALHVALCCAARRAVHLEYFHDHVRIEAMLFDGAPVPRDGWLGFDASRPGLGLELKEKEAECWRH